jgi:hypothetical protein
MRGLPFCVFWHASGLLSFDMHRDGTRAETFSWYISMWVGRRPLRRRAGSSRPAPAAGHYGPYSHARGGRCEPNREVPASCSSTSVGQPNRTAQRAPMFSTAAIVAALDDPAFRAFVGTLSGIVTLTLYRESGAVLMLWTSDGLRSCRANPCSVRHPSSSPPAEPPGVAPTTFRPRICAAFLRRGTSVSFDTPSLSEQCTQKICLFLIIDIELSWLSNLSWYHRPSTGVSDWELDAPAAGRRPMIEIPQTFCEYCGGLTSLVVHVPRLGAEPATSAFLCNDCTRLTWVAIPPKSWASVAGPWTDRKKRQRAIACGATASRLDAT